MLHNSLFRRPSDVIHSWIGGKTSHPQIQDLHNVCYWVYRSLGGCRCAGFPWNEVPGNPAQHVFQHVFPPVSSLLHFMMSLPR